MGYLPYQLVSRISSINSTSTLQCGLIRHVNFKATFGVLWKTHQFFYCKTYDFRLENNIGPTIPFPQIFYKRSKGPSVIFQHKKKTHDVSQQTYYVLHIQHLPSRKREKSLNAPTGRWDTTWHVWKKPCKPKAYLPCQPCKCIKPCK